jgi:hypothetical protein
VIRFWGRGAIQEKEEGGSRVPEAGDRRLSLAGMGARPSRRPLCQSQYQLWPRETRISTSSCDRSWLGRKLMDQDGGGGVGGELACLSGDTPLSLSPLPSVYPESSKGLSRSFSDPPISQSHHIQFNQPSCGFFSCSRFPKYRT